MMRFPGKQTSFFPATFTTNRYLFTFINGDNLIYFTENLDQIQAKIEEENASLTALKEERKNVSDHVNKLMAEKDMIDNKGNWTR